MIANICQRSNIVFFELMIKCVLRTYYISLLIEHSFLYLSLYYRSIAKTELQNKSLLFYCLYGLTNMIGKLGLVYLTDRKTGQKRISRQFVNKKSIMVC